MKKIVFISLTISMMFLQGCSTPPKHQGINWGDGDCPAITSDQLNKGYLILQDGKTLKCQIKPYVSNMACQGITDDTNADAVLCQNANGSQGIFLFDSKGVLIKH